MRRFVCINENYFKWIMWLWELLKNCKYWGNNNVKNAKRSFIIFSCENSCLHYLTHRLLWFMWTKCVRKCSIACAASSWRCCIQQWKFIQVLRNFSYIKGPSFSVLNHLKLSSSWHDIYILLSFQILGTNFSCLSLDWRKNGQTGRFIM